MATTILSAALVAAPGQAQVHQFNIEAQPAQSGIAEFARQADIQILASQELVQSLRISAVKGSFDTMTALKLLLAGTGLEAQQTGPGTFTLVRREADTTAPMDTIIVTGRAGKEERTRADTSYSISVIPQERVRETGISSVADTIRSVPGFWVENSGGEASANVRARGIPVDGYNSIQLEEDGMPIQHDPDLGYLNVDQSFRVDETIDQVQVLRGGPSSVFASNAPGGTINYVSRKVSDRAEGLVKATVGDDGLYRTDFWFGAPLADGWKAWAGGFYRQERGTRDPGYDFNHGGQIRLGASHDLGNGTLDLDYKHIDDHVGFYLGFPVTTSSNGSIASVPGLDASTGILAGPQTRNIRVRTSNGFAQFDTDDGTAVILDQASAHATQDVLGWHLDDHLRARWTDQQRIGLFPSSVQTGALRESQLLSTVQGFLPAAASLQLRYVDNGALFQPNQNGNGLEVDNAARQVSLTDHEVMNDLRASRTFEIGGQTHDVTAGLYFMFARETFDRYSAVLMEDVTNHARLLNMVALNTAGQVIGSATENGVLRYGSEFANGQGDQDTQAVYLADEWQLNEKLRIDGGVREEVMHTSGRSQGYDTIDLGLTQTLADKQYRAGNGIITPYDKVFSSLTATLGVNYQFDDRQGVFARATKATRMPSISDFITDPNNNPITTHSEMYELGYKYSRPLFDAYVTFFDTEFHDFDVGETVYDQASAGFISKDYFADTRDYGIELDGDLRPVEWFDLAFSATLQNPTFTSLQYTDLAADGKSLVTLNYNGKQLLRIPKQSLSVTPSINLFDDALRAGVTVEYYSDRFADAANSQKLPAYTVLSANARYRFTPDLTLYLSGYNLTNSIGLTEGNPRAGELLSSQAGAPVFIARPIVGRTLKASLLYKF